MIHQKNWKQSDDEESMKTNVVSFDSVEFEIKICFGVLAQYFLAVVWTHHWLFLPFCLLLSVRNFVVNFQMGCGFRLFSLLSWFTQCVQCRAENHLWNTFCFAQWELNTSGKRWPGSVSHGEHRVSLVLPVQPRRSQDRLSIPMVREQHPGKTLGSLVTWIKAVFTSQSHLAQHIHTSFLLTGQTLKVQI